MAFIARFSRREAGGYDCTYGKGKKQLTAVMEQVDGKMWKIVSGHAAGGVAASKKCSEVKEGWAALAASAYGAEADPETVVASPAPPVVRPGPPSLRKAAPEGVAGSPGTPVLPPPLRAGKIEIAPFPTPNIAPEGAATCPHCHMPFHGWSWIGDGPKAHAKAVPPCMCSEPNPIDYSPDPFDGRMWERDPATMKLTLLSPFGALDKIYHWMMRNREYVMSEGKLDEPWAGVQDALWRESSYAIYRPELWTGE